MLCDSYLKALKKKKKRNVKRPKSLGIATQNTYRYSFNKYFFLYLICAWHSSKL